MEILDRLLGKKKRSPIFEQEEDYRLKGFKTGSLDNICKRLDIELDTFSELLDYLDSLDQTYVVIKNEQILGRFEEFPLFDEVMDTYYNKYGGGQYVIKSFAPKTVRLGVFSFEGEEKDVGDVISKDKKKKGKPASFDEEIIQDAIRENPKFKEAYIKNLLKGKGVDEDDEDKRSKKKKTVDEIVAEEIEKNPQLREKVVQAEIDKRFGKDRKEKEKTPIESAKEMAEHWKIMKDLFGEKKGSGVDWGEVFAEFMKQGGVQELVGMFVPTTPQLPVQKKLMLPTGEKTMPKTQKPKDTAFVSEDKNDGVLVISAEPSVKKEETFVEQTDEKALLEDIGKILPYISSIVSTITPQKAVELLNGIKPEYADKLYDIDYDVLIPIIKKANESENQELKGKFDTLLTQEGQNWLHEFLEINKTIIDKDV